MPRKAPTMPKPKWHPPWKLYRVISGHIGWVRSLAIEPANQWFVSGSNDRTIKIWDLVSIVTWKDGDIIRFSCFEGRVVGEGGNLVLIMVMFIDLYDGIKGFLGCTLFVDIEI